MVRLKRKLGSKHLCTKVLITSRFNDKILDDHFLVHEGCVIMMFYVPQEPKSGNQQVISTLGAPLNGCLNSLAGF